MPQKDSAEKSVREIRRNKTRKTWRISGAATPIGRRGGALGGSGEASNSRRLLPYCFRRNRQEPQRAPKYLKRWWPRAESRASEAGHAPAKRSLAANCRHLDFQFVRMVCTGLSSGVHKRSIPTTYLAPEIPPRSVHVHQYPVVGLQRGYTALGCKSCEASRMNPYSSTANQREKHTGDHDSCGKRVPQPVELGVGVEPRR